MEIEFDDLLVLNGYGDIYGFNLLISALNSLILGESAAGAF
jgi:hypothetical protein